MTGNSAEVGKKPKVSYGICVVSESLLWQLNKTSYLYFIRTIIYYLYVMSTDNLD